MFTTQHDTFSSESRVPLLMASCCCQTYFYLQYFVVHRQSIGDGVLMDWLHQESDLLVMVCQTKRHASCSKLYQQAVRMLKKPVCSHLLVSEYLLGTFAPVMKDAY